MGKIISISNQKGGVGKTTTAVNLAASLASAEKSTLLVDLDPQANASSGVGVFKEKGALSVYDLALGRTSLSKAILSTDIPHLFVLPANTDLIGFEIEFIQQEKRETILKQALSGLERKFDYIILDCPPSLSLLTINGLTYCNSVLIPLQCEYYALEGLSSLMQTLDLIRQSFNPNLSVEGILLTMYDGRNNLSKQVAEDVRTHFRHLVFSTVIPRNVRLSESPSFGKPILLYDIHSPGAEGYLRLAKEFLSKQKEFSRAPQRAPEITR